MSYCSSTEVLNYLGKDAKTKVRSEVVGTSSGTTSTSWSLDHDNVISGSVTLYTDSTIVPTASYTLDLDDGDITSLSVTSGSVLTADYDYSDIADSIVQQMISGSDALLETQLGRTFNSSSTTEYLTVEDDQDVFFLKNYPVLTLSSVQRNIGNATDTDWDTLAQGLDNDFIANSEDLLIGRIRCIDNKPYIGDDMLKVTYSYGFASVPALVKELSILLTLRQMMQSSVYKSIFEGYDGFTPVRLNEINERIEELKKVLGKQSIEPI
jgi:hypothetical protein